MRVILHDTRSPKDLGLMIFILVIFISGHGLKTRRTPVIMLGIVYEGKIFKVNADYVGLPNGRRVFREYIIHPGAVVIIPLIGGNQILLVKQYRPVVSEWLYELPAGTIEENESPEETAIRELEEETGYKAGWVKKLGTFFSSPGISTERMHVYLAGDLERTEMKPEFDELLQVIKVELKQVYEMILQGEIIDGKTIAAMMLYHLKSKEPSR